jgi:hypothetical protein
MTVMTYNVAPTFTEFITTQARAHDEFYYTMKMIRNCSYFLQDTMDATNPVNVGSQPHSCHRFGTPINISHTVNGCTGDGLAPPCWLPYIFVATINTVEIGILRFQGMPWIHSWNCPRENKWLQHCWYYDLGIAKLVSPTKNANHVCCKGQPISLGGAQCIWGERLLDIYLLPEQLLLDEIRIYRDHYKYDNDNGRFVI